MLAVCKYKFPFTKFVSISRALRNFVVCFITNPLRERDKSEGAELISSALDETVSETELINLQMDLLLEIRVNGTKFCNLMQFVHCSILQRVSLNVCECFGSS
jgi:hypothetical protein